MALIEVEQLSKTYRDGATETRAVQGVSFQIHEGEFVAIMGPSGSGKSTILHIMGFLDTPTGGIYRFEGKHVRHYSDKERAHVRNRKMGFVFQAFNLLPRTTVYENVKLPLFYSDVPESEWDARVRSAIASVNLSHRAEYDTTRLSGGEKQRAAIARALVMNPPLIFADEPTGNLDSKSGAVVMETLQKLNEAHGRTIILITHETLTAEHAGRILHVRDGKIEVDIHVAQRRTAHSHEFSK
ncbi:MAG: ABC transporter ATP-binding protein [Candidatus Liptonbacteria bacterium]|nr:ABC transporter ATP-binding protein [Candidatus Liptonbacteria bacterium]